MSEETYAGSEARRAEREARYLRRAEVAEAVWEALDAGGLWWDSGITRDGRDLKREVFSGPAEGWWWDVRAHDEEETYRLTTEVLLLALVDMAAREWPSGSEAGKRADVAARVVSYIRDDVDVREEAPWWDIDVVFADLLAQLVVFDSITYA